MTSILALVIYSVLGYIVIGIGVGRFVSIMVYKDTDNQTDAYSLGIVSATLWPLACLVMIIGGIWFRVIKEILTPPAVRKERKAEYEKRVAEAVAQGKDPDQVPKHYVPHYED